MNMTHHTSKSERLSRAFLQAGGTAIDIGTGREQSADETASAIDPALSKQSVRHYKGAIKAHTNDLRNHELENGDADCVDLADEIMACRRHGIWWTTHDELPIRTMQMCFEARWENIGNQQDDYFSVPIDHAQGSPLTHQATAAAQPAEKTFDSPMWHIDETELPVVDGCMCESCQLNRQSLAMERSHAEQRAYDRHMERQRHQRKVQFNASVQTEQARRRDLTAYLASSAAQPLTVEAMNERNIVCSIYLKEITQERTERDAWAMEYPDLVPLVMMQGPLAPIAGLPGRRW